MQARALMSSLVLGSALPLMACQAALDSNPTDHKRLEVTGSLQRLDADNPRSAWAGTELVQVVDPAGVIVCETDIELDGESALAGAGCEGCSLVVDILRYTAAETGDDCQATWDPELIERSDSLLAYAPTDDRARTTVRIATQQEGPWVDYADGWYTDGKLIYRRSVKVGADTDLNSL